MWFDEHFGLPCQHALRVMINTGVRELPQSMILMRWTKEAQHVVPQHLAEYSKDNPALLAQTYRHSSLLINILEFLQMGDSNAECHPKAMAIINNAKNELRELAKNKDGLGLVDRMKSTSSGVQQVLEASKNPGDNFTLHVPKKKRDRGRPSNTRDKPQYDQSKKKSTSRKKYCKTCRSADHTNLKCPFRDPATKKPRKVPTCTGCNVYEHSVNNCENNAEQVIALTQDLF